MEQLEPPTFGELLRQWRSERGWTQEHLAAVAGLSIEAIGALERAARQRPRQATVQLLIRALDLSESDRLLFAASAHRAVHAHECGQDQEIASGAGSKTHTFLMAQVHEHAPLQAEQEMVQTAKTSAQFALHAGHAAAARGGKVIEQQDGRMLAVFPSPRHGLIAGADLQARFSQATAAGTDVTSSIGISVVIGEALRVGDGYQGPALTLASRLCRLAGPGEVLTTDSVVRSAHTPDGLQYVNRGAALLKGFASPLQIIEVQRSGCSPVSRHGDVSSQARHERSQLDPHPPIGGFLGSLPAGHIVGRAHELDRLEAALDVIARGTGQLILLSGEAGIGKTRLAQEVSLTLRNHGFITGTGHCYEPQASSAFFPFVDALAAVFAAAPHSISSQSAGRWPYLGKLLPNTIQHYPVSFAQSDDQQHLFHSVSGFIQALAEHAPVALLLDDLHWADRSSLALLHHLARETRNHRVLLLGTYRHEEIGSRSALQSALVDLDHEALITNVAVRRLDVDATSELIGSILDEESISPELSELVHLRTEGNPYFVEHVLRAMVERGDIFRTEGNWDRKAVTEMHVPQSIRSVVSQRVARLSGSTQVILQDASVTGHTFSFEDLEGIDHRSQSELDTSLQEATLAGLVRVSAHDRYSFDHALTQQTLYEELSPRRRRTLHLAAGMALERVSGGQQGTHAAELARHFLLGNDTQRACAWSMVAGDRAVEVFAYGDAERHYQTVVQLAEQLGDHHIHAHALENLGRVYRLSARHDEAHQTLELAACCHHDLHNVVGEGRAIAQIGRLYLAAGLNEEGAGRIEPFLADLEAKEQQTDLHGVIAEMALVMAHLHSRRGAYGESAIMAARASERARRAHDDRLLAEAEFRRGTSLSQAGDFEHGFPAMQQAIAVAETVGDLDTLSQAVGVLALFHWDRGEMHDARVLLLKALTISRRLNDPTKVADKLGDLAWADFTQGRWASALQYLQSAQQALEGVTESWVWPHHDLRLGEMHLARGEQAEGLRLVEEGHTLAERDGNLLAECEAVYVLSDHALFSGNPELSRSYLQKFLDSHAGPAGVPESLQTWSLALFARLFAEMGEVSRAEELLRKISDQRVVAHLDNVHSVRAVVAASGRKWDEAERNAEAGLAFARRGNFIVSEARLLYYWGRWRITKGEPNAARERLFLALNIFRQLGARPYIERIEEMLRGISDA